MAKFTKTRNPSRSMVRYRPGKTVTRYRSRPVARSRGRARGKAAIGLMSMAVAGGAAAMLIGSKSYQEQTSDSSTALGSVRAKYGNGPIIAAAGYAVKRTVSAKYGNALMALGVGLAVLRFVGMSRGVEPAQVAGIDADSMDGDDDLAGDDLAGDDD